MTAFNPYARSFSNSVFLALRSGTYSRQCWASSFLIPCSMGICFMECKSCLPRPFSFHSLRYPQYRVRTLEWHSSLFCHCWCFSISLFIRSNIGQQVISAFRNHCKKWTRTKNCDKHYTFRDLFYAKSLINGGSTQQVDILCQVYRFVYFDFYIVYIEIYRSDAI